MREQIKAGKSDAEIRDYMVQRNGDFVLYRPPVKSTTLALWLGLFALLIAAFFAVWMFVRRRRAAQEAALSGEQEARGRIDREPCRPRRPTGRRASSE